MAESNTVNKNDIKAPAEIMRPINMMSESFGRLFRPSAVALFLLKQSNLDND